MCQSNDGASECGIHLHPMVVLCGCKCSLDMEERVHCGLCRGHREEAVELRTDGHPCTFPLPSLSFPVLACPCRSTPSSSTHHPPPSTWYKASRLLDCPPSSIHSPTLYFQHPTNHQPPTTNQQSSCLTLFARDSASRPPRRVRPSLPYLCHPLPLTPLQSPPTPRSRPPRRPARACLAPVTALPEPSSLVRPSMDPPFLIHSLTHHRGPEGRRPEGR
jgi:hypothetical protein